MYMFNVFVCFFCTTSVLKLHKACSWSCVTRWDRDMRLGDAADSCTSGKPSKNKRKNVWGANWRDFNEIWRDERSRAASESVTALRALIELCFDALTALQQMCFSCYCNQVTIATPHWSGRGAVPLFDFDVGFTEKSGIGLTHPSCITPHVPEEKRGRYFYQSTSQSVHHCSQSQYVWRNVLEGLFL